MIAEALKINQSLTSLNLKVTFFIFSEKFILINKKLKIILLQRNRLRKEGAAFIAEALKINQSLEQLNLSVSKTREAKQKSKRNSKP